MQDRVVVLDERGNEASSEKIAEMIAEVSGWELML